jgi:Immunoglobulin V-set domain
VQRADRRQGYTNLLQRTYWSLVFTSALTTLVWPPTASGRIVTRPGNTAAVAGSDVTLNCSVDDGTSTTGNFAHLSWHIFTSDRGQTRLVTLKADISKWSPDSRRRYNISARTITSGFGSHLKIFDLTIRQLREADAGLYSCNSSRNHYSAYLIVLGSTPTCSSNLDENGSELVENDTVQFTCSVKSFADHFETFAPHFRWTWLSFDDEHGTFQNKSSVVAGARNLVEIVVKAQPSPSPTLGCLVYFVPTRSHEDTLPDPPLYTHHCEIDGWSNRYAICIKMFFCSTYLDNATDR